MIRPRRSLGGLPLALLLLGGGCFSEPEPVVDDGDTVMCVQAPCTASGDASTGPAVTSTSDDPGTTAEPEGSTSDGGSTSPSPSDETTTAGAVASCGNGEIDQPTEMCDSTPGCLPDCTFESYDCNPLSDAGCIQGLRCGAIDVETESFGCMPAGRMGLGSPCFGMPSNDSDCGEGLTCLFNINTPLCDEGNCCVEYCALTDAAFRCGGGAVCRQFIIEPMYVGLEHLGYCGEP